MIYFSKPPTHHAVEVKYQMKLVLMLNKNKKCNGIEEAYKDFESFKSSHFFCRCFLDEAAPVISRRAWVEFLRIEEDLGTCAFRFFKKSNPVFKHSGGGISL